MQPILLVALIGVAAAATGIGFLNTEIVLNVQNLGVGSEDLETPISSANVDLSIGKVELVDANDVSYFVNVIDACSFHYDADDNENFPGLADGSQVICKLTKDGNVVAEGSLEGTFVASTTYMIPITDFAYDGANDVKNVNDITIVALGADPTPP